MLRTSNGTDVPVVGERSGVRTFFSEWLDMLDKILLELDADAKKFAISYGGFLVNGGVACMPGEVRTDSIGSTMLSSLSCA